MAITYKIQNQNGQLTVLDQQISFWANDTTISTTFNVNVNVSVSIDRATGVVIFNTPLQDTVDITAIKTALETAIVELNNVL